MSRSPLLVVIGSLLLADTVALVGFAGWVSAEEVRSNLPMFMAMSSLGLTAGLSLIVFGLAPRLRSRFLGLESRTGTQATWDPGARDSQTFRPALLFLGGAAAWAIFIALSTLPGVVAAAAAGEPLLALGTGTHVAIHVAVAWVALRGARRVPPLAV